jgi:hypothetical protein
VGFVPVDVLRKERLAYILDLNCGRFGKSIRYVIKGKGT